MSSKPWKVMKVAEGPGSTARDAGNLMKLVFGLAQPIMEANGIRLDEIFEIDHEDPDQFAHVGVSSRSLLGIYTHTQETNEKTLGLLLKDHMVKDFGNGHYWRHFADLMTAALHELTHAYLHQSTGHMNDGHNDKFYATLFEMQHQYYECYTKLHDKLSTFVPDEATIMEILETKQTNHVTDTLGLPYVDGRAVIFPQDFVCELRQWAIELKLDSEIAEEQGEKIEHYKGTGVDEPPVRGREEGSRGGGGGGGGIGPGMGPGMGPPFGGGGIFGGGGMVPGGIYGGGAMGPGDIYGGGGGIYGGGGGGGFEGRYNPHCPVHGHDPHHDPRCPLHGCGNDHGHHGYDDPYGGGGGGGYYDRNGNCGGGGCSGSSCDNGYGGGGYGPTYGGYNFNGDLSSFLNGLVLGGGNGGYSQPVYGCAIPGVKGKSTSKALAQRTKKKPPRFGDVFRSIAKGFFGEKKICASKFTDDKGYMGMKTHPKHKRYVEVLVDEVVKTKTGKSMSMSKHCCAATAKTVKGKVLGRMKNMVVVKEEQGKGYKSETSQWEKDEVKRAVKAACAVKIGKSIGSQGERRVTKEPSLFSMLFGSSKKPRPKMIMDKPSHEQKKVSHNNSGKGSKSRPSRGKRSGKEEHSGGALAHFGNTSAKSPTLRSNVSNIGSSQRYKAAIKPDDSSDYELQAVLERSRNEARKKEEEDLRKALKESSKYR